MDLKTLSADELHDLSSQINAEWERRRSAHHADQAVAEVVTGLQDDGKLPVPEAGTDAATAKPWVNPGTDHAAMYRRGDVVTHNGRTWESRHPHLNHWEPGSAGVDARVWADITPPEPDPDTGEESPQEWRVGLDVAVGDLVTHDGQTWRARTAHATHEGWAPSPATHAVWEPVGESPA